MRLLPYAFLLLLGGLSLSLAATTEALPFAQSLSSTECDQSPSGADTL